jgi:hypothetical protein
MFSKKLLSAALAAALTLSAVPATFASTQFKDVNDANLASGYNDAINWLSGLGIVSGDATGNFNPNANVKRSEVAKIIDNTLGYGKLVNALKSATTKFSDVSKDNWAAGYVNVAAQKGLIKGVSDTKFAPDDNVTYGQYLTIALRALGYTDEDVVGTWPVNYETKAIEVGLLDGIDSVDPYDKATRKDIAVITQNTLLAITKDDTYNTNDSVTKPTLFSHVSSALGVKQVGTGTAWVIGDKTTDPSLGDSVLITTNLAHNETWDTSYVNKYTLAVSDDQKAKFALGAKVNFYATSNAASANSNKIVYLQEANRDALTITPTTPLLVDTTVGSATYNASYFTYKVGTTDTKALVASDAYVILNGKKGSINNVAANADATVTLVREHNYDSKYNFAIVSQVNKPVVVSHDVLATDTAIKVLGSTTDLSLKTLSTDSTGTLTNATVKVSGSVSNLGDIKRNDVLYVTQPADHSFINIEVVRNAFSGKIVAKTVDGNKLTSITVGGAVYTFNTNPLPTDYNVDDTVDITAGKNNTIVSLVKTNSAVDVSAYGIILDTGFQNDAFTKQTDYVKYTTLGGTVSTLVVSPTTYAFASNYKNAVVQLGSETVNGVTYSTFTPNPTVNGKAIITTGKYNPSYKVSDTKLYVATSNAKSIFATVTGSYLSDFAAVGVSASDDVWIINKTNTLGDYAAVILKTDSVSVSSTQDITAFGYIKALVGTTYVGTQKVNQYTAWVNGTAVTLNVKDGVTPPVSFSKAVADTNNIVTSFSTATVSPNVKPAGMDATRISVGGVLYTLDANTKVYDKDDNAKTIGDLKFRVDNNDDMTVTVTATSDNKAAIIKMTK